MNILFKYIVHCSEADYLNWINRYMIKITAIPSQGMAIILLMSFL